MFVASWFEGITGVPISPILTPDAVLMASGLGLLIPIVAAILPIRDALGMFERGGGEVGGGGEVWEAIEKRGDFGR